MASTQRGVVMADVCAQLGLAAWQVRRASEVGLLRKHPRVGYVEADVLTALADLPDFLRRLDAATLLNATDAAARLHVSTARFTAAADAAPLTVQKSERWKYGVIRYWLAGDVDTLVGALTVDTAERAVRTAHACPAATAKAAATRARNKALAIEAVDRLNSDLLLVSAHPLSAVQWICALLTAYPDAAAWPAEYERFRRAPEVIELAAQFTCARPTPALLDTWVAAVRPVSVDVVSVAWAADHLQVLPDDLPAHLPTLGSRALRADVAAAAATETPWLAAARLACVTRQAEQRAQKVAAKAAAAAEKEAERLEARTVRAMYSVQMLADTWGIPIQLVRALHPHRGWGVRQVQSALANRPAWALNVATADQALSARREILAARAENRQRKDQARRRHFAAIFGMPVDALPGSGKAPNVTEGSTRALTKQPPRWVAEWRAAHPD